jgi:hypothetical protein
MEPESPCEEFQPRKRGRGPSYTDADIGDILRIAWKEKAVNGQGWDKVALAYNATRDEYYHRDGSAIRKKIDGLRAMNYKSKPTGENDEVPFGVKEAAQYYKDIDDHMATIMLCQLPKAPRPLPTVTSPSIPYIMENTVGPENNEDVDDIDVWVDVDEITPDSSSSRDGCGPTLARVGLTEQQLRGLAASANISPIANNMLGSSVSVATSTTWLHPTKTSGKKGKNPKSSSSTSTSTSPSTSSSGPATGIGVACPVLGHRAKLQEAIETNRKEAAARSASTAAKIDRALDLCEQSAKRQEKFLAALFARASGGGGQLTEE